VRAVHSGQDGIIGRAAQGQGPISVYLFVEQDFPAELILECYRFRWQIELVFKRFKQIAQLGHLPKYDEESAN
jgi:IS4 transposase